MGASRFRCRHWLRSWASFLWLGASMIMIPLCTSAQTAVSTSSTFTARDLANEEGKFAAYSVKTGMWTAFRAFFADQSILLRPDPVDAQAFMKNRADPPILLDWRSQLTVLSASGDMGLSTGPWTRVPKAKPDAPKAHGQFFSVWQKQRDGQWKVIIDHGVSHETAALSDVPLNARELVTSKLAEVTTGLDPEQAFIADTTRVGMRAAYAATVNAKSRLLRDEKIPADGPSAINAMLKDFDGSWTWTPLKRGASSINDMEYRIGNYLWTKADGTKQSGHYVRVWVREAQEAGAPRRWVLAGEVATPAPEPPPAKR